ncbi:Peptidase S1, PA clan [Phytophthora cactorum]|nr:Peptidase S1, PA clan [Phytophthora cactorum]
MNLASAFVYAVSIAMASASLATNAQDGSNISVSDLVPSNFTSDATATPLKTHQQYRPQRHEDLIQTDLAGRIRRLCIKDGEIVTKLGWYNTGGESQDAHELQCADVQLMSNEECSKVTFVDDTRMCSHPVGNQCSCTGDYGGPLIVERPEGDVLVGMVSWGDDCKKPGTQATTRVLWWP